MVRTLPIVCAGTLLLLLSSGCFRYSTYVPGVIDVRTDARGAKPAKPQQPAPDADVDRGAFTSVVRGRGVVRRGGSILIRDRHYWIGGFIPIYNDSATEEIAATLEQNPVLTRVVVGEAYDETDIILTLGPTLVLYPTRFFLPPWTFEMSGVPVEPPARASPARSSSAKDPAQGAAKAPPAVRPQERPVPTPPPALPPPDELEDK